MNEEEKHDELVWDALVEADAAAACFNAKCPAEENQQKISAAVKKHFVALIELIERDTVATKTNCSDLELAAEIGKSLLERNRELEYHLRRSQEYAEDEHCRAEFLANQVDVLREENEIKARLAEQLENQLQETSEKYIHDENDNKLLRIQNRRLMETTDLLEKRLENAQAELKELRLQAEEENSTQSGTCTVTQGNDIEDVDVSGEADVKSGCTCNCAALERQLHLSNDQIGSLRKSLLDLQLENKTYERQQLDFEDELKDILDENEILQQQLQDLQVQLTEWQEIAQKAKQRSQRIKQVNESSFVGEKDSCCLPVDNRNILGHVYSNLRLVDSLTKSKSCEVLSEIPPTTNIHMSHWPRTPGTNNANGNGSVLAELDCQYEELVQRYETLLRKFKDDGKLAENPTRSLCVQKAIQTVSNDFYSSTGSSGNTQHDLFHRSHLAASTDYRKKFAEIFLKLKEFTQK